MAHIKDSGIDALWQRIKEKFPITAATYTKDGLMTASDVATLDLIQQAVEAFESEDTDPDALVPPFTCGNWTPSAAQTYATLYDIDVSSWARVGFAVVRQHDLYSAELAIADLTDEWQDVIDNSYINMQVRSQSRGKMDVQAQCVRSNANVSNFHFYWAAFDGIAYPQNEYADYPPNATSGSLSFVFTGEDDDGVDSAHYEIGNIFDYDYIEATVTNDNKQYGGTATNVVPIQETYAGHYDSGIYIAFLEVEYAGVWVNVNFTWDGIATIHLVTSGDDTSVSGTTCSCEWRIY